MFCPRFFPCAALIAAVNLFALPAVHAQTSLPIFGPISANNSVERALAARVSIDLADEVTVGQFAAYLREQFRINVVIDNRALDDVGLGSDTPMTDLRYDGVVLEDALNMILEQLDLCFMVRDVVLIITTPEEAENHLSTHVYPVGDLLFYTQMPGPFGADYDTLIEIITSTIAPDTWDEVGGAGAIEPDPYTQSLVISQTRGVHKQVQALIETLRKAKRMQPAPPVRTLPNTDVGSVPYRPGTTPTGPLWNQGRYPAGGFF